MTKVIIIDDDPDLVKLFSFQIGSTGIECITASGGEEGLKKIQENKPDVIVLDIQMPEMDGLTVFQRLQSDESTKSIPIIFLTATLDFDQSKIPDSPKVKFITKPCDFNKLIQEIKGLIQQK